MSEMVDIFVSETSHEIYILGVSKHLSVDYLATPWGNRDGHCHGASES